MSRTPRESVLGALKTYEKVHENRLKVIELEEELKRCLQFMVFWPEGYNTVNEKTGKKENPKITWDTIKHENQFRRQNQFEFTMTREDLDESRTFRFKVRRPKSERYQDENYTNRVMKTRLTEKPTVGKGMYSWVIELVWTDAPDLDNLEDIPQAAIAAVCSDFVNRCMAPSPFA